jgi:hypothetical protein
MINIFSFAVVSAQQNDFFDIQKHIHKKNEEIKKMSIDSLYIRGNKCWESTNLPLSKRGFGIIREKIKTDILKKLLNNDNAYSLPPVNSPSYPLKFQKPGKNNLVLFNLPQSLPLVRLSHSLPDGNKVYLLPQDNMPYIVPDMSQFNMPNIAKANNDLTLLTTRSPKAGRIPSAIAPY